MTKKYLFVGMAVLLGASLSFFSCEQDAKTETVYVPGPSEMIHIDEVAATEAALKTALLVPGDLVIGLTASVTLTEALTIPDGKVVYVLSGATLATDSGNLDLTVEGIVYVGAGATLDTSDGKVKVPDEGRVYVVGSMAAGGTGGTLVIADPADVNDGTNPDTVLGTAKVSIGNATLKADSTVTLPDNDAVTVVLAYVGSGGTIDLSEATVTSSKPSTLAAIPLDGKKLIATAAAAETETGTLPVPAGLTLTAKSDDTLETITGLTVSGSLTTAAGTLAGVTTLTVNGELDAEDATLAAVTTVSGTGTLVAGVVPADKAKTVIESGLKSVSLASTTITAETLTVPATTTLTLTGAAAPSGDVTVNGKVVVPTDGSLTIAAGKTLANAGAVALTGTGSVALKTAASGTTGGAKITGTGTLTAQDLEISGGTGGWLAVLDSGSNAETVTIASTVTAGQASITGSTSATTASLAGGAGATITQKAGTASNSLTLTTVTLDLSAAGSLTLKGGTTNGAKVKLAAATAIIKGGGSTGDVTESNITAIGSLIVAASLTIDTTNTTFTDNATGNAFFTITGGSSAGSIETKSTTDLTLDKTTTLTYS